MVCWQGKHDMEILALQEFSLTLFQPLGPGQRLALGAMAVRARVVRVAFVAALITPFQMTAEGRCATQFDGAQYPLLPRGQRASMRLAKLVAVGAHNVGDFQGWPHRRRGLGFWINNGQREQIQRAGSGANRRRSQPEIAGGGRQTAVSEQKLNSADISPGFK